ncbi:wsc2, partial [Metarhizium majus ARSEF 297]
MALMRLLAVLAMATSVATAANPTSSDDMGPAAFMWPEDRVWSAAADNTAPCGSVARVGNRTNFPLTNGQVALVDQKEAYSVQISNSYDDDPKEDNDFTTLIKPEAMAELDKGHTCIKYVASFDKPEKETFYACADITYVDFANFKEKVPCFNATVPEDSKKNTPTPTSDVSKNSGSAGSGLSGGGTAGVVIGVVGGVALIAAAALLIYRRKQQRLRMLRQKFSPRNIKPDGQHRDSPSVRSESA